MTDRRSGKAKTPPLKPVSAGERPAGSADSPPPAALPARLGGADARLRAALTVLLVLQVLAAFLPGPLLWGMNHLAYAPLPLRLLWPLAGLVVVWTPLGARLGRWLSEWVGRRLIGRPSAAFLVAPVVGGALLWLARARVPYLGDGWLLGELVARGHAFHGFDWIAFYLHAKLFHLLGLQGDPAAFALFGVMSTIAGACYLAAAAWAARGLAPDASSRALVYALLILFAPVQMFLGYVECYAFLLVALLIFLVALVRHARGELPLAAPAAAFGAALFFHLDALFLAPLLVAAVVWPPSGRRARARDLAAAAGLPLLGLALAVAIHLAEGCNSQWFATEIFHRPSDRPMLMPLGGSPGLLSLVHVKDVVNLVLLLCPAPLALLIAARPQFGDPAAARTARLLVLSSLWVLALAIGLNMVLGMPRDWDLLAAPSVVAVLAAALAWIPPARTEAAPRTLGTIAATACALALPWFWLNAGSERALARLADVIGGQSAYAQAYAHEEIGKHYRKIGDTKRAAEEYRRTISLYPRNARFHALLGALLYNAKDRAGSFEAFRQTLEVDPDYPQALEMMARLHAERGELETAIGYARRQAGRDEETPDAAELHGSVAEQLQQPVEAMSAYQRAYAKDPTRVHLLEKIGALGFLCEDFAASERAFRLMLQRQPRSPVARKGLVLALMAPLRREPSLSRTADGRRRLGEALALIEAIERDRQADELTGTWRREIEAALQPAGGG